MFSPTHTPARRRSRAEAELYAQASSGPWPDGLRLDWYWKDRHLGASFLRRQEARAKAVSYSVGSAEGVDFVLSEELLGVSRFEVARSEAGQLVVRFPRGTSGTCSRAGEASPRRLEDAVAQGEAVPDEQGAFAFALERGDQVSLDFGALRLEARVASAPRSVRVPWSDRFDLDALNVLLAVFFVGALFIVAARMEELERERWGDALPDRSLEAKQRFTRILLPPRVSPTRQVSTSPGTASAERATAGRQEKAPGAEGARPKGSAKRLGQGENRSPLDPSEQARLLARQLFGRGPRGVFASLDRPGLDGGLRDSMRGLVATAPGGSGVLGGIEGLKGRGGHGDGPGGGGPPESIGIDGLRTRGRSTDYGARPVELPAGKDPTQIVIGTTVPEVDGSLDRELVREVIHRHRSQIRYCYESQLNRKPSLAGKVSVQFVIAATGSVVASDIEHSTAEDAALEQCVRDRVASWLFPKPKGGGVVRVKYPFLFRQSGG